MKSVTQNINTIIIKNSRFITLIYPVNDIEEIFKYLNDAKINYPDATHYCYAYIIDNLRKESDDGEPSGTAGIPILQVLEKQELNHVLCIVIRYFGKIKLGAGGLVRAYTKSAASCLKDHIVNLEKAYLVKITFAYEYLKKIDYLLSDCLIKDKLFDSFIIYKVVVSKDMLEILKGIDGILIEELNTTYLPVKDSNS